MSNEAILLHKVHQNIEQLAAPESIYNDFSSRRILLHLIKNNINRYK